MKRRGPPGWVRPSLRGWIVCWMGTALTTAGWRLGRPDFLALGVGCVVAVLAGLIAVGTRRRPMAMGRTLSAGLVEAGGQIEVHLAPLAAGDGVQEAVWDRLPGGSVEVHPGQQGTWDYAVELPARGRWQIGPGLVRRRDGLGLARRDIIICDASPVVVAPRLVPVLDPERHIGQEADDEAGGHSAERVLDPSSVREYQPGDSRRIVHWRASARRGRLMVRGDQPKGGAEEWIVVDTVVGRDGELLEEAIALAASVAMAAWRLGRRVRLVQIGGAARPRLFEPAGGGDAILTAFADMVAARSDDGAWVDGILAAIPPRRSRTISVTAVFVSMTPERAEACGRLAALADPAVAYLLGSAGRSRSQLVGLGWAVAGDGLEAATSIGQTSRAGEQA